MRAQRRPQNAPEQLMTGRQTYNLVTDLVGGPNVRLKDNLLQGLAALVCMIVGVGIGLLTMTDRTTGALLGALVGVVVAFFGSGLFLMIYRLVAHARGKHD